MPRPPVKKTMKLAEAQAYGETLGKLKAEYHFKQTKKGWLKSIREHVGKWIDNINPLETAAILGLTYIIKVVCIEILEDFIAKRIEEAYYIATLGYRIAKFIFGAQMPIPTKGGIKILPLPEIPPSPAQTLTKTLDQPTIELIEWLIAFTCAYIIIKHGGQLFGFMKEGMANLKTIVGALLGTAVLA